MTDIISAIVAIKSDAEVSVNAEDINQITWHDGNPTNITTKQITDKQAELQTAYNNNKYQRDRAVAWTPNPVIDAESSSTLLILLIGFSDNELKPSIVNL